MTKELASARTPAPPPESALAVSRDLGLAVVATLMVGYADFLTGIDLRVFPLYFVPVGIIAWRGHRSMSLALTVLAIAVWEMSNRLAGMHYPSAFVFYWNLGVQWLSLLSCALLLSRSVALSTKNAPPRVSTRSQGWPTAVRSSTCSLSRQNDRAAMGTR